MQFLVKKLKQMHSMSSILIPFSVLLPQVLMYYARPLGELVLE